VVWSMAESIHYYKTHKEESIKVAQKYTRGLSRDVLEGAYAANTALLVEDTYPTLEGLKGTLEVQALTDARAPKPKWRTSSSFVSSTSSGKVASSTNFTGDADR
jgi:hypothetical protein